MTPLATLTRSFAGHPLRVAAALGALALFAAVAWYLVSPLFIRTSAAESLAGITATLSSGELNVVDEVHRGSGRVRIVEAGGRRYLRFEDVAITNGPDLHVYLSTDTGGRYVEANVRYVAALRATDGSFHYELPASLDTSVYRSAVVWCRAFGVLFSWADLR